MTIGSPAPLAVSLSTDPPKAGPALRVRLVTGVAPVGGSARPVYVVSADELATMGDKGNTPIPVAVVTDGRPVLGDVAPIPVTVVSDE